MNLDIQETVDSVEAFGCGNSSREPEFRSLYSRYGAYRDRLRFLSEERTGRCELHGLTPGMLMLVVDVQPTQGYHAQLHGQDILEFHFRLSGSLEMAGRWGELSMKDASLLMWYQPTGYDDVREVMGSVDRRREVWVSLYCDIGWLREVLDDRHRLVVDSLTGTDGSGFGPRYRLLPRLDAPGVLLRDVMRNPYEGMMRTLYARGKGLQLLCDTVSMLSASNSGRRPGQRFSARDRNSLRDASEILSREYASPPDLRTLARRVGLNTAKLCSGFSREFGETTSDFVRRCRLEQAKALLLESDLQVRQVAAQVGYRHHSTFTAAFTRYFGAPPTSKRSRKPA